MPLFRYKAMAISGGTRIGTLEAASAGDAVVQIQRNGDFPIAVTGADAGKGWSDLLPRRLFAARRPSARTLSIVTQELAALIQAGLPLDRALEILLELEDSRALRVPLQAVLAGVRDGHSLGDSLRAAEIFPAAFIAMVRAGEAGGDLEGTLRRLADYLGRTAAVRDAVISALIYPAILLFTAGLSVFIILVFVLPEFTPLFSQSGRALPWPTQIVMAIGSFLSQAWWMLILGVASGIVLGRRLLRRPRARRRWDAWKLRLPIAGNLLLKIDVERFSRALGSLMANGVSLPQALAITRDTLANLVIADAVGETMLRLKEGEALAWRLRQTNIFPPVVLDMVRIGEETGRLDEMLLRHADFSEREIRHAVDRLLALLVPLLTVGMGFVVAGLIASILMAILSVNDLAL